MEHTKTYQKNIEEAVYGALERRLEYSQER